MALLLMFNSELDVAVLNITMPSTATSSSLTVLDASSSVLFSLVTDEDLRDQKVSLQFTPCYLLLPDCSTMSPFSLTPAITVAIMLQYAYSEDEELSRGVRSIIHIGCYLGANSISYECTPQCFHCCLK